MDTIQSDQITTETVVVKQVTTGRVYCYSKTAGTIAEEDIDVMKKRIAEREGIPESCIKWNNPNLKDYESQETFFKNKRTIS
jgi:hypothetical protein